MYRKSFTLIELIAIMATVTLLTGLLSEVLANSKNEIKKATCINNLSQIGKMAVEFSSDNQNYSLPSTFYPSSGDKVNFLSVLLNQNDANSCDTFTCPSMEEDKLFDPYDSDDPFDKVIDEGSYIMNSIGTFTGSPQVPANAQGWSHSSLELLHNTRIRKPAETFYILDAIERPDTYTSQYFWSVDMSALRSWRETDHALLPTTTGSNRRDVGYHHTNASFNVLFGDGRVANRLISQTDEWVATHD